jgi:hypothetical protein
MEAKPAGRPRPRGFESAGGEDAAERETACIAGEVVMVALLVNWAGGSRRGRQAAAPERAPRSAVLRLIPALRCRIWADSAAATTRASGEEAGGKRTDSGGVAERPKAAVLKTAEGIPLRRFESFLLRQDVEEVSERWPRGRRRWFAKPVYGVTCIAGSNPALSASLPRSLGML